MTDEHITIKYMKSKKLNTLLIYVIAILLGFMVFMALGFSVRYDELVREATKQATTLATCILFK